LRLVARANGLSPADADLARAAEDTGSDVPVCLAGGSRMMGGRGEVLGPLLRLPPCSAVLVNPGARLETARVFRALATSAGHAGRAFEPPAGPAARGDWLAAIAACGNDLEAPAIGLEPAVETARQELGRQPDCLLARMTGSGATVFGLFAEAGSAEAASHGIARARPSWWVQATTLGAEAASG
jgi:4-diphosphocytidyl-2-C-methyl-D-erythritol kinase